MMGLALEIAVVLLIVWLVGVFFWCSWIFEFQHFCVCFKGVRGHRLEVKNCFHICSVKSLPVLCGGMECISLKQSGR